MKIKKHLITLFLTIILCSFMFGNFSIVSAEDGNVKHMVSAFDCYNDYCCCDISNNSILSLNTDKAFITEGNGSLKFKTYGYDASPSMSLAARNSASDIIDIENIVCFSIDIYNANDFDVSFIWVVNSLNSSLCSKYTVLKPNQWTNVRLFSDRTKYVDTFFTIQSYGFDFLGTVGQQVLLYLDNFYVIKNTDKVEQKNEKQFAENEILFFDDINDLNFIYGSGTATHRRTVNEFSICQIDYFAKSGYSLNLSVRKLTKNVAASDVWTDGTVPYYAEETGFQVSDSCISKISFFDKEVKGIAISVYHDYSIARKVHFKISDLNGRSVEKIMVIEPNTWTDVIIDSFGEVNRRKVETISFYYEAYQTFQNYNFYFDNLRLVK